MLDSTFLLIVVPVIGGIFTLTFNSYKFGRKLSEILLAVTVVVYAVVTICFISNLAILGDVREAIHEKRMSNSRGNLDSLKLYNTDTLPLYERRNLQQKTNEIEKAIFDSVSASLDKVYKTHSSNSNSFIIHCVALGLSLALCYTFSYLVPYYKKHKDAIGKNEKARDDSP